MPGLKELSIADAVDGLKSREFSCAEYIDELIAQCEASTDLNALISWNWDKLRAEAVEFDNAPPSDLPLAGIPLVLKDNINTASLPTTGATGALQGFVPKTNAPVAQSLFSAGAMLGGKGNMHELAFGITNNNPVTGAARNPFNRDMIPGGSSGGVAAAVAQRLFPGGIGTDTGASVRLPASLCGLVGFRPTVGRYPGPGIIPISHTRDTAGPIVRTVADAILLDQVMSGPSKSTEAVDLKTLRLGVPRGYFYENLEPSVAAAAAVFLDNLQAAGVNLVESDIPDIAALNDAVGFPVALYELMQDFPEYLRESGLDLTMQDILDGVGSEDVKGILGSQLGEEVIPAALYQQVMQHDRPRLQAAYARYFEHHTVDAILFPTAPLTARPIGDDEMVELNGSQVPTFPTFIRNTDPASNAGIPGISLPAGLSEGGLPIGMELDGPEGSDCRLLAIAESIDAEIGIKLNPAQ
ncbi:MAG: amidase [Sneathiella sp.]|nr:MAG: amidase [Sneathiella sp.]